MPVKFHRVNLERLDACRTGTVKDDHIRLKDRIADAFESGERISLDGIQLPNPQGQLLTGWMQRDGQQDRHETGRNRWGAVE